MKRVFFALALLAAVSASAQVTRIVIPAGTPEDQALVAIGAEADAGKRAVLLEQFLQQFADNKPAAAYGYWQLALAREASGDFAQALDAAEKAVAAAPGNLDILVSAAGIAQQAKQFDKLVEFAAAGGAAFHGIAAQPKPADAGDAEWSNRQASEESSARPSYEYLEAAAYNAIASEQNAAKRMAMIERFSPAFPKSKFEEPVAQYAIYTLQQLNQPRRLVEYGEKTLASNPDSIPTLLLLANAYSEDEGKLAKAIAYANKVIKLADAEAPDAARARKLAAGVAYSTLGYTMLKQGRAAAAVPELRRATVLLEEDAVAQAIANYRLGFGLAKLNRKQEALAALGKAAAVENPFQGAARDLIAKIKAVR